jgi:hypothetical protein
VSATKIKKLRPRLQAVYALTINAEDGAPSSLIPNSPNITPQKFRIAIADKNDNPPYFPQQLYRAEVPEDQVPVSLNLFLSSSSLLKL